MVQESLCEKTQFQQEKNGFLVKIKADQEVIQKQSNQIEEMKRTMAEHQIIRKTQEEELKTLKQYNFEIK